jgi:hypothetical protein
VLLKVKWISGQLKPYASVDDVLIRQGFKRYGKQERPLYQLTIQDSSTQTTYYLIIPTVLEDHSPAEDLQLCRIGNPYIRKKFTPNRKNSSIQIPDTVKSAATCKLAEVYDYLLSPNTKIIN